MESLSLKINNKRPRASSLQFHHCDVLRIVVTTVILGPSEVTLPVILENIGLYKDYCYSNLMFTSNMKIKLISQNVMTVPLLKVSNVKNFLRYSL